MIHPSGNVMQVIVKTDLELRGDVQAGDINWVIAYR